MHLEGLRATGRGAFRAERSRPWPARAQGLSLRRPRSQPGCHWSDTADPHDPPDGAQPAGPPGDQLPCPDRPVGPPPRGSRLSANPSSTTTYPHSTEIPAHHGSGKYPVEGA